MGVRRCGDAPQDIRMERDPSNANNQAMSPEESTFVRTVEALFLAQAGRGLMLSPLDEMEILKWARSGVTLEIAQRGIEAAFERLRAQRGPVRSRPPKLTYCRPFLLEELAKRRQQAAGKAPPPPTVQEDPAIAERLHRLCERLAEEGKAERDPTVQAAYRRAYRRIKAILATKSARDEVQRVDDLLCDELYLAQPPHAREELDAQVQRLLARASTAADESAQAERLAGTRRTELRRRLQIVRLEL